MTLRPMTRLVPPLLAAAVLTACASSPPPTPVADESAQLVAKEWGASFRMRWQFAHEGHVYELVSLYAGSPPHWTDRLVFIDGRLACDSTEGLTGVEWFWVSQPDGLAYLAGRLENACGHGDSAPPRHLRDAVAVVPAMPVTIAELPASEETSVAEGAGAVLSGSLVVGVSLILSPLAIAALPVVTSTISSVEAGRAQVTVGMQWADALRIVGDPAGRFQLPASATDVQVYGGIAGAWYVGIRDGQVLWISNPDDWLDSLAKQSGGHSK